LSRLPLADLLVVSLEQAVAAPFCTSKLAAAGARVIKVERADGDFARAYDSVVNGESAYFVWLNHGKESLVLNIKDSDDRDFLLKIIDEADVFVHNLAPGATGRAGLGNRTLRERNDRLITCDISGYGQSGSYRDMKAYDLILQCETGLASITGGPAEPGRVGVSVCDIACGMNAYLMILEALIHREQTGTGKELAISLFDVIADWMNVPYLHQVYGGKAPQRTGISHPSIVPYGAYETGDGGNLVIGIQNDREWARFCEVVCKRSDLVTDPRFVHNEDRVANRHALDDLIGRIFLAKDKVDLIRDLKIAAIAFGSLNSVAEFSRHPQLKRLTVETMSGPVELVAPPGHDPQASGTRVPGIGQHSAAIRQEFGAKGQDVAE